MFNEIRYINDAFDKQEKKEAAGSSRLYGFELENISQAHHYTITIDRIKLAYTHPVFGKFLPVRSASFTYAGFESMNIPVGIYGDLPVLKRRSVGKLSLQLYDNSKDEIALQIKNWINSCFPGGTYVNYLSNMASKMYYTSYDTTGRMNQAYPLVFWVIPTDSYSTSRSYEENGAKILDFSLIVVGDMSAERKVEEMEMRKVPTSSASAVVSTPAPQPVIASTQGADQIKKVSTGRQEEIWAKKEEIWALRPQWDRYGNLSYYTNKDVRQ